MRKLVGPIIVFGALALLVFLWGRLLVDAFENPTAMVHVVLDLVVYPSLVISAVIFLIYGFYKLSHRRRSN